MIMRNDTLKFVEDAQTRQNQIRDFTRILRVAKPLWQQVLAEPENHIARGLVYTTERGITADLSFNKPRKRVILTVKLRTIDSSLDKETCIKS